MCSVAVQFSHQILVLAIHFNPLSVKVNGVAVVSFVVSLTAFIIVNLCNCWK